MHSAGLNVEDSVGATPSNYTSNSTLLVHSNGNYIDADVSILREKVTHQIADDFNIFKMQ